MPSRSDYQPLRQSFDDEDEEEREEVDVGVEGRPAPAPTAEPTRSARGIRRAHHPGNIDLRKLDTAFKRCAARSSAAGLRGVDGSRSRVCVFVCGRSGRTVGQVDGEHRAEDEAEEEGGGRACKEGDLAERVRPARPPRSPSHRNRESSCPSQTGSPPTSPPFGSFHYSRHVTAQVKTLDHKSPMTEAEFTAYVPALFLRRTPRPERRAMQVIWCWASSTP